MKTLYNITNTVKLIAIISFVLGTCLLLSFFLFPKNDALTVDGLYYVGYATLINAVLFLVLIIMAFVYWDYRVPIFKTCGVLLLNIPVAIGYFFIVMNFLNF